MVTNPDMYLESGVTVGDFRIEQRLGAGGMGVVYRARQVSLNRVVALKVLGGALQSATGIARFRREAQAVAKLKHPNIAGVHFIGQDEQVCYIVMEYVEGVSFREVIRRSQRAEGGTTATLEDVVWRTSPGEALSLVMRFDISTPEEKSATAILKESDSLSPEARQLIARSGYVRRCVELVRDVARALAYAHEQGIVHRDVKPENLLLDASGKVTVIDFGLARFYEDESITYTGQLIGTPLYMSPEQILGRHVVDCRTDIYSLGMVLHELLTLTPPMQAENRESLFRQIATRPLPPIRWRNTAVPEDLTSIVHHALAKDPDERYASMAELARDLQSFLDGMPVAAPPYRYRIDEGEIIAQRPGAILYLAFNSFFVGVFHILLAAIQGYQLVSGTLLGTGWLRVGVIGHGIEFFVFAASAAAAFLVGPFILQGRTWGRRFGIVFGLLLSALSIRLLQLAMTGGADLNAPACLFWSAYWAIVGVPYLVVLSHPKVRRWFRFAADSRAASQREWKR